MFATNVTNHKMRSNMGGYCGKITERIIVVLEVFRTSWVLMIEQIISGIAGYLHAADFN